MEAGLNLALLVFLLVVFAVNTWLNIGRFKALKAADSLDRIAFLRGGLVKSLLLFLGGALITLIVLHRLDALGQMPAAFGAEALRRVLAGVSPAVVYGVAGAWIVVICLASLMGATQMKRLLASGVRLPNGALGALLPRTGEERFWAALVAVNAGLSEELFFRLALPLLLVSVTGNPAVAFAGAACLFGLGHAYQGPVGVILTGIIGAMLGFVYLYSGSVWLVIALHAGVDLWSLVAVPLLIGWNAGAR